MKSNPVNQVSISTVWPCRSLRRTWIESGSQSLRATKAAMMMAAAEIAAEAASRTAAKDAPSENPECL